MQIPERVRTALLMCGLTAAEWRLIRKAFELTPATENPEPQMLGELTETGERLVELGRELGMQKTALAEERKAMIDLCFGGPIPDALDELEAKHIKRILARDGHLGIESVARTLGIGKTTLYRKLPQLGFQFRRAQWQVTRTLEEVREDVNSEVRAVLEFIPSFAPPSLSPEVRP